MFKKLMTFLGYCTFGAIMVALAIMLAPLLPIIAVFGMLLVIGMMIGRKQKAKGGN